MKSWTVKEIEELKYLRFELRYKLKDIAYTLDRSIGSVSQKLKNLKVANKFSVFRNNNFKANLERLARDTNVDEAKICRELNISKQQFISIIHRWYKVTCLNDFRVVLGINEIYSKKRLSEENKRYIDDNWDKKTLSELSKIVKRDKQTIKSYFYRSEKIRKDKKLN